MEREKDSFCGASWCGSDDFTGNIVANVLLDSNE